MTAFPKYPKYKDSGVEWLGDVPEHWEVSALRACAALNVERNRPDLPVLSVYREYGVILKDSRDDNHNATSLDTSNYKVVHPGDLAVNKMKAWQGSLGVSEHHGIVSPAYITCKVNQSKVAGRYLHYLLRSKPLIGALDAISYGVRVGQWDMRFEDLKQVSLTYPPRAEQDRIVAFLDEKTAEIGRLIAKKQRQIELLDEQKAILINRAVTRGLNVNAQIKDTGVDWIGTIPAHWEMKKLRWILSAAPKNGVSPPITESGDVPTLSISAVKNGKVNFGEHLKFTKITRKERQAFEIKPGDLLALRGNGSRHLVATCGQVGVDVPRGCIYPDLLIKLVAGPNLDAAYLIHLLNGPLRQVIHLVAKTSAGIWKVSGESLGALKMPLPPREEQSEIVMHLFEAEAAHSQARSKIESQIQTLQNLRSTLIAHAVTGKIKV